MADIKTKDKKKGTIKAIDKASVATQRMKQTYIASKEKVENAVRTDSNSPEEYADEKIEIGVDEITHDGAYLFDKEGRKGLKYTKENYEKAKDGIQRFKQQRAERTLRKQSSSTAIKTVDTSEKQSNSRLLLPEKRT